MFDLEKGNLMYRAIQLERVFPLKIIKILNIIFILLALIFLAGFLKSGFLELSSQQSFAIFIILICFFVISSIYLAFVDALRQNFLIKSSLADRLSAEKVKDVNLAQYLDFRVARAIVRALKFCQKKKRGLNTFAVVYYFWEDAKGKYIFNNLGLDRDLFREKLKIEIKQTIEPGDDEQKFMSILKNAAVLAISSFHRTIEARDFLVAAAEGNDNFRNILSASEMTFEDVDHMAIWEDYTEHEILKRKQFWLLENLLRRRGVGKRWAAGYTVNLDHYSVEVTEIIKKEDLSINLIGHKKEIYAIERILSRSGENNVLLIGEPCSGRSTIAYGFAKKVVEGRSFQNLNDKRVLELDMQAVLAGLNSSGDILERLRIIFTEAISAGNIILIIDEIHNYLGSEKGPGAVDITSVLLPYLNSPNFQIIGLTTIDGWHKYIENNTSVKNLFVKVEMSQPTSKQTIFILEDMLPGLERKYNIFVSYRILRDIIKLTDRYMADKPFPAKAVDILTEVLVYTKQKREKAVLPEYVNKIISERVEIPIGAIHEDEKKKLLHLEERIHERIVDQEEAVKVISQAMRRARVGMKSKKRPIGSFLFLGPTGVGKTETSKALAEAYFGSDSKMIRFDMSEYQEISTINRLIGSEGKSEPGLLTNAVNDDPFSLILLDEIEKAHPNILNLFLQVLDEGWLTNAFGKRVNFAESIIIGTSNAGSELIRQCVKQGRNLASFKEDLVDYLMKEKIFRAEFLNRFDAVVVFKPLSHDDLIKIAVLMMNDLSKRLMEGTGVRLIVNSDLVEKIVKLGYKPEFGARPMRRVIQDEVESRVAKIILEQNLKRGDFVEINANEIKEPM
ncbi:ATP-dependent Clp protease ATP-binding subunit [Patescibacteria group bacterium]|nr:ATP-dependent Clp protease ATP-binding subunit [Patescibacteria group bacterium]MBU4458597.1 ATP-dependent Clp protease ATP-binding subunit [Patescibacteria group bacterium]MCG2696354.1 ATP-dependent Clp protease ATP-binding subunit [Candidatus Portnoybacteria bacterium]